MKIILLKDVAKVGKKFDVKEISEGYAHNLLIPKGLAIAATPDALKRIDIEKARDEGERKVRHELLVKNLKDLDGVTITMLEKANDKGHLFAGIHKAEIIPEIQKQTRIQIDAEHMVLDKPIKELGMHVIEVKVENKSAKFNLDVQAK
jgi:large subunit ribosomal protein L9